MMKTNIGWQQFSQRFSRYRSKQACGLALLALTLALLAQPLWRALAAAGDYDTTFSGDGKIESLTQSTTWDVRIAIQHDGKALALVDKPSNSFQLVRLNLNGDLDNTFSGDGVVSTDLGGGTNEPRDLAIHSNGKIVVAGTYRESGSSTNRLFIVRYLPNGNLDTSFSDDGKLIGAHSTAAFSVACQPNGKILVADVTPMSSNQPGNGDPFIVL
jgi:uncharacterized delta-60 repeat protein